MNKASATVRTMILRCLTDGMGVRPTARAVGVSKGTVLRLLAEAGEFAAFYHDFRVQGIRAPRQEFDEQWSFVGARRRRSTNPEFGDAYTFVCLATETRLVVSYLTGERSRMNTDEIVADAAARTVGVVDISTDGFQAYVDAISRHYTWRRANYTQVVKNFDEPEDDRRRYGPSVCTSMTKTKIMGTPNIELASTSYVENLNLHTRQKCRRFARLTNQHSKSFAYHCHAVALHFFAHNFIRVHSGLTAEQGRKTTPAMMHGLASRPWTVEDLINAMDPTSVTIK